MNALHVRESFRLKHKILQQPGISSTDFYKYLKEMNEIMKNNLEKQDQSHFNLIGRAISGDPQSVSYFLNEIEKHLRRVPFTGHIPTVYPNITQALFQEWRGFGPAYPWFVDRKYSRSSKMQIIGKRIFFANKGKYELFPYEMSSHDRVEQLKRALISNDPRIKLDASSPEAELKMDDPLWPGRFLRLAIWVNPRVWDEFTTITARRQIVEYLSLEDQAGTGSIPAESIEMISQLSMLFFNTIIAGPIESGKSTFANTIVGEQLSRLQESTGVVMIEKHPESILPYVFKKHRIIPVIAKEDELMDVGISSLRMDVQVVYMTEMRYHEWEFYNFSGEKGHKGLIGTYHTTDAEDIPYQGANAVYTKIGGNLKGHLHSTLTACKLVFIMESHKDGEKRLSRISEIRFDKEENKVYAHDIMRWDPRKDEWSYHEGISDEFLEKARKVNRDVADQFVANLNRLAKKRRIENPRKESVRANMALSG